MSFVIQDWDLPQANTKAVADPVPYEQLLPSLARLTRGLSALFWGLPLTLILCFQTARTDWLRAFGVLPPLLTTGLLLYGVMEVRHFQPLSAGWRNSVDRTLLVALVNTGLAPFLYWWSMAPEQPAFNAAVALLVSTGIIFLSLLNLLLCRLGELLPNETLRQETSQFTVVNRALLVVTLTLVVVFATLLHYRHPLPFALATALIFLERFGLYLVVAFVLLPMSLTMAMLWKAKEVIFESVFSGRRKL